MNGLEYRSSHIYERPVDPEPSKISLSTTMDYFRGPRATPPWVEAAVLEGNTGKEDRLGYISGPDLVSDSIFELPVASEYDLPPIGSIVRIPAGMDVYGFQLIAEVELEVVGEVRVKNMRPKSLDYSIPIRQRKCVVVDLSKFLQTASVRLVSQIARNALDQSSITSFTPPRKPRRTPGRTPPRDIPTENSPGESGPDIDDLLVETPLRETEDTETDDINSSEKERAEGLPNRKLMSQLAAAATNETANELPTAQRRSKLTSPPTKPHSTSKKPSSSRSKKSALKVARKQGGGSPPLVTTRNNPQSVGTKRKVSEPKKPSPAKLSTHSGVSTTKPTSTADPKHKKRQIRRGGDSLRALLRG